MRIEMIDFRANALKNRNSVGFPHFRFFYVGKVGLKVGLPGYTFALWHRQEPLSTTISKVSPITGSTGTRSTC
jgi:hypothetical protein